MLRRPWPEAAPRRALAVDWALLRLSDERPVLLFVGSLAITM